MSEDYTPPSIDALFRLRIEEFRVKFYIPTVYINPPSDAELLVAMESYMVMEEDD